MTNAALAVALCQRDLLRLNREVETHLARIAALRRRAEHLALLREQHWAEHLATTDHIAEPLVDAHTDAWGAVRVDCAHCDWHLSASDDGRLDPDLAADVAAWHRRAHIEAPEREAADR